MNKKKILLVEDEENLALILKDTLEAQGYEIIVAPDGEDGLNLYYQFAPDVIVTDVMMPKLNGFEMVKRIRQSDKNTPVLFLTAKIAVSDVVEGFSIGANDYLRKPFSIQELMARIKSLVKISSMFNNGQGDHSQKNVISIGEYKLNYNKQILYYHDKEISISNREAELLKILAENAFENVDYKDILLKLWGNDGIYASKSLQVFITKLRHKLANDEAINIINVRGEGYKLVY
jgi:DNA-binding response OmpR family regulator